MMKNLPKHLAAISAVLIFSLTSIAITEVDKISINRAVEIAGENNLDIQSSRLNLIIKKNDIKSADKLINPAAGVFYNLGKSGKGNPQQIGITQTVEAGKRRVRKELAKSKYDLEKRNIEYLEADLRMDVREAYTNLLAKKSVLAVMIEQEELLNNLLKSAKDMYQKGKTDEIDALQAQLLLNQIKTQVNSAEYDVKTALYDFNKVINSPSGFYDTIEDHFTEDYKPLLIPSYNAKMPNFETISQAALNNRTDIKIAEQQIETAKKNLSSVIRQRIPDFELQAGYSYQNRSQSDNGQFKHGAYIGAALVDIPLLYTYKPEINNAKIQLEQAYLNYASVQNKALNDLKKAYEKFLTAQINIKYYNDGLLKNSEKLIESSRKSYKAGKTDLTTLITMEESYRMIVTAYTYALADYYNAWNLFIREVNNENFKINYEQI